MATTQETPVIDYWAIFNELMKTQDPVRRAENIARTGTWNPAMRLREYSTIGLTTARQTGKTKFVAELLEKHPTSVMVVTNLTWKNMLFESHDLITGKLRLPEHLQEQVITAKQLIDHNPVVERQLAAAPFVIMDESELIYQRICRRAALTLLADYVQDNVTIVEIN